jgi:trehalose-phosphatase
MIVKTPLYLFDQKSDNWNKIAKRLRSAPKIALFLDYDGTLTPIRRTPPAAVLSPEAEQILKNLLQLPNVRTTIVTGRSMEDIRRLIPLEGIGFAANHGFHILQDNKEWIHPDAVSLIQLLSRLHAILRHTLESFPAVYVENKQFTLSIHYRNIPIHQVKTVQSLALKTIHSYDSSLIITRGKKVLEVRPPISWGKGNAVLEILKTAHGSKRQLPLFLGDDTTDEDVFQVLKKTGITIRVERSSKTVAQYYVRNVDDVLILLKLMIMVRA